MLAPLTSSSLEVGRLGVCSLSIFSISTRRIVIEFWYWRLAPISYLTTVRICRGGNLRCRMRQPSLSYDRLEHTVSIGRKRECGACPGILLFASPVWPTALVGGRYTGRGGRPDSWTRKCPRIIGLAACGTI